MKYVVIIGDGMADFPIDQLGGATPLMAAKKPFMNMMAREGFCGKVFTVPEGFHPGSDVACMSIFGYNPANYYTGRAPIEAAGMGIAMGDTDVAFRCNLVYLDTRSGKTFMGDYSGGHITTEEAGELIADLDRALGGDTFRFFPGVSYRHIMVWKGGAFGMSTTPPHDITNQEVAPHMPAGEGAATVASLMEESRSILRDHPVNQKRRAAGKFPANSIWLWGQGRKARFPSFVEKYRVKGATVAAVDLIKGISSLAGFDTPFVEGATGYLDTDYGAKARKALDLLQDHDIVYVHIEAPDEASHNGSLEEKIKAIESIDREVVGRMYEAVKEPVKFLIVTDHATPISMQTHYGCPVPFAVFLKGEVGHGCPSGFDERAGDRVLSGEEMITYFLRGQLP
jgi:2,3-bisphosphoglycerate-independent phosphoglycerate mutase